MAPEEGQRQLESPSLQNNLAINYVNQISPSNTSSFVWPESLSCKSQKQSPTSLK
jgi:hypothetical protein